jgi:hypothetical protein
LLYDKAITPFVQKGFNNTVEFVTSVLALVSENNLHKSIKDLTSYYTRHSKSKFINQVAEMLKTQLEDFGYTNVYFHDYTESGYPLKNVICHKQGLTNKVIAICAHYDSIMEEINNAEDRAPGADDNASGVSAVLEIARLLHEVELQHSIQFIFFSGEEQGQWGSKNYAQSIKENKVEFHRLINLDMVGNPPYPQTKVIIERDTGNKVSSNDQDSQSYGEFMKQMAMNYTDLQVIMGPIYDSDYMPFEALGYVVVGIYDGGQVSTTYHSKTDVPSTLNMEYIVAVTRIVLATILNETRAI